MERIHMRYSPKATVFSLVFLAGAVATAQAQSVANLPPAGAQPAAVVPPAYSGPAVAGPNPGSNISIPGGQTYQKPADWDSNRAYHPYSSSGAGPNPGSNVTANTEPAPLAPDAAVNAPYSQGGTGPSPGANINIPSGH
jgi:hypothetical protein